MIRNICVWQKSKAKYICKGVCTFFTELNWCIKIRSVCLVMYLQMTFVLRWHIINKLSWTELFLTFDSHLREQILHLFCLHRSVISATHQNSARPSGGCCGYVSYGQSWEGARHQDVPSIKQDRLWHAHCQTHAPVLQKYKTRTCSSCRDAGLSYFYLFSVTERCATKIKLHNFKCKLQFKKSAECQTGFSIWLLFFLFKELRMFVNLLLFCPQKSVK